MTRLVVKPNIARADDFYAALLAEHETLSREESDAYNARLLLVLANQIGDMDVLAQALEAARK
ncbi:MAG: DUF2783 domain-containing protein [Nitratireductor sp.]